MTWRGRQAQSEQSGQVGVVPPSAGVSALLPVTAQSLALAPSGVGFLTRYDGELRGASHVAPGKSGVHAHGEGESVIALESW